MRRLDLVDFVEQNPDSTSHQIAARFPKASMATIRSALYELRKDGYLRLSGTVVGARGQKVFLWRAGEGESLEATSFVDEEIDYEANDLRWHTKCAALSASGRPVDFGSTRAGSNLAGAST